jgi:hypothetical protein
MRICLQCLGILSEHLMLFVYGPLMIITQSSSVDLGYYNAYADTFQEIEIIPSTLISAPLALVPICSKKTKDNLWIAVSFDRVSTLGNWDLLLITSLILIDRAGA